jgi:hypothetical protein
MQGTILSFVRLLARLGGRGCSRSGARIAAPRRLAVACSAALTAGLAAATFTAVTAGPASAAVGSGICLDANAQETYNFGAITQYNCNAYDQYQSWSYLNVYAPGPSYGRRFQIFNQGAYNFKKALDCLDANAQQVYDGGQVMQYACDPNDYYQQWIQEPTDNGPVEWMNFGDLVYNGVAMCLDAYGGQEYHGGKIIQYACNANHSFQQWTFQDSLFSSTNGQPVFQMQLNY